MDTITVVGLVAFGWVLHALSGAFNSFSKKRDVSSMNDLLDKVISKGDPVSLYNLRVADKVSSDKRTIEAALQKEIARAEPAQEIDTTDAPWENHPEYIGCDVTFDFGRNVVTLLRANAQDGPDMWEEDIDEFMSKFENTTYRL